MRNILQSTLLALVMLVNANASNAEQAHGKDGHIEGNHGKVLIVLTSNADLGETGKRTGFWLPELTHPYYEFIDAGFKVDIASPKGGQSPLDGKSLLEADEYSDRFLSDATLMAKVFTTIPLASINPKQYDAIVFSGGSGPMWDFPNNADIDLIATSIYENGGIVSAVCHGTVALAAITLSNGEYLVKDKRFAAFTRAEEIDIQQLDVIPYLIADKLSSLGGTHSAGKPWMEHVVVDGRLITGQNPASAKKLAQEVISAITRSH